MLGQGCPWKGTCRHRASGYEKKNYCNSDSGCYKCPHRPMNDGNRDVQKNYNYAKGNHNSVNIFWVVIAIVAVLGVLKFLGII